MIVESQGGKSFKVKEGKSNLSCLGFSDTGNKTTRCIFDQPEAEEFFFLKCRYRHFVQQKQKKWYSKNQILSIQGAA